MFGKYDQLADIMHNLYAEIENIKGRTLTGMVKAVRQIQNDTDETIPLVPVKYGNLRSSFFCTTSNGTVPIGRNAQFIPERDSKGHFTRGGNQKLAQLIKDHRALLGFFANEAKTYGAAHGPTVIFGYTAFYAFWVHETIPSFSVGDQAIGWSREGSGPKWFEKAIQRNKDIVLRTIIEKATPGGVRKR